VQIPVNLKREYHFNTPTRFKKGMIPHNKLPDELREITKQLSRLKKNIKEREKRYATQQN
jgi:hypothetical protein